MTEEQREAAELAVWIGRAKAAAYGALVMFTLMVVWAFVAPTYTGNWLGASMGASFVVGCLLEVATRERGTA